MSAHLSLPRAASARRNPAAAASRRRTLSGAYATYGFVLGVLVWTAALRLGIDAIPDFQSPYSVLMVGVAGAFLAHTRARILFGIVSGLVCVALLTVMYTPIASLAIRHVVRIDAPARCEGIVVLHAEVNGAGQLTDRARERLFHTFGLLRQGYAREMVLTQRVAPEKSPVPAVKKLMAELRFDYPVSLVGPIVNTRDEAVAATALARERGWDRVILVSHPAHMRRASETFKKAGLPVLCVPSPEGRYDLSLLRQPEDRLTAFRDWLHEEIGYRVYRLRGWL
ncbi:MAG: YdcF family protein [Actinomycetota bacterium]